MLVVIHLLTRRLFVVPFEWARMAAIVAVLAVGAVGGELLLPAEGVVGLATRSLLAAVLPLALLPLSTPVERELLRRALRRG